MTRIWLDNQGKCPDHAAWIVWHPSPVDIAWTPEPGLWSWERHAVSKMKQVAQSPVWGFRLRLQEAESGPRKVRVRRLRGQMLAGQLASDRL